MTSVCKHDRAKGERQMLELWAKAERLAALAPHIVMPPRQARMNDWRKIGEQLFKHWEKVALSGDRSTYEQAQLSLALLLSAEGSPGNLIEYLQSGKELALSDEERAYVVARLRLKPKQKRGPRRDHAVHMAANTAWAFYLYWKVSNTLAGVSNRGIGNQMKDEACHFAIALLGPWPEPFRPTFRAVRDLIERPKHRRDTV
jgi:hypothetical protein